MISSARLLLNLRAKFFYFFVAIHGILPIVLESVLIVCFCWIGLIFLVRLKVFGSVWRYIKLSDLESVHIQTLLYFFAFFHETRIKLRRCLYARGALWRVTMILAEANWLVIRFKFDSTSRSLKRFIKLAYHLVISPGLMDLDLLNWFADRIKPLRLLVNFVALLCRDGLCRLCLWYNLKSFWRPEKYIVAHSVGQVLFIVSSFDNPECPRRRISGRLFLRTGSTKQTKELLATFLGEARAHEAVWREKWAPARLWLHIGLRLVPLARQVGVPADGMNIGLFLYSERRLHISFCQILQSSGHLFNSSAQSTKNLIKC